MTSFSSFCKKQTKQLLLFLLCCFSISVFGQELNCYVEINAEQVKQSNKQVFNTLKSGVSDFINKTRWTNKVAAPNEKLDCSVFIRIKEFSGQEFLAEIQIQSSRPVYNSTYNAPVFNFKDEQFRFTYVEYQDLTYNPYTFNSNLLSVLSFYVYTILGMDADTFSPEGGTPFYQEAQKVMNLAQGNGFKGWDSSDGTVSRFRLIDDLLTNTFSGYRRTLYEYHRNGLDLLTDNPRKAKENIAKSLGNLEEMNNSRPNSLLLRVFFDAKADEINSVFSEGPPIDLVGTINTLNKLAPAYASKWANIQN